MRTEWILASLLLATAGCKKTRAPQAGPQGATTAAAAVEAPRIAISDCGMPTNGSRPAVALASQTLGQEQFCWLFPNGTVRVEFRGNPGGRLMVGTQTAALDPSGNASVSLPLDPVILRTPVQAILDGSAGVLSATFPVRYDPPAGPPLVDNLQFSIETAILNPARDRMREMLADVGNGNPVPRGASPPAVARGSMVYIPAGLDHPVVVRRNVPLAELDLVAIARDGATHPAPACGPYRSSNDGPGGTAPRQFVDVEVSVYETATGNRVAQQTFSGNYEGCPYVAMTEGGQWVTIRSRPETETVRRALARIAENRQSGR